MKKKGICLLTALALVLGMCSAAPLMSGAAPTTKIDIKKEDCSLTVYPAGGNAASEKFTEDLESAKVVVDIYKVADASKNSGYDSYSYELLGGYESMEKLLGSENLTDENWRELAQLAAKAALSDSGEMQPVQGGGQKVKEAVEKLGTGLYLIVARGADLTELEDYVITIENAKTDAQDSENPTESIATIANSDKYTYVFAPQLISIPMRGTAGESLEVKEREQDYMTSDGGDWVYDLKVYLKPQRVERYGSLKIIKDLQDFMLVQGEQPKPVTFVFEITWKTDEGDPPMTVQHRKVESLSFTGSGKQEVIVDQIPAGAKVTVTEVYSGAGYQVVGDSSYTATIKADKIHNGIAVLKKADNSGQIEYIKSGGTAAGDTTTNQTTAASIEEVTFVNKYSGELKEGSGIKNRFIFEDGSWKWYSDPPQNVNGNSGLPPKVGAQSDSTTGQGDE